MRLGWFTPTECAAITIVYSVLVGAFVYRRLKIKYFKPIILEFVNNIIGVFFIIFSVRLF